MPLIKLYKKYQIFKNILNRLIYKKVVYLLQVKDLNEKINFSFSNKLKIQRIEQSHLGILREFSEKYDVSTGSSPIIKIEHFLNNQYKGFMALLNGDTIGYAWWVDNKISPERNHPDIFLYEIELKDGEAYGTDTYIAPPYRGSGNSIIFLNEVFSELKKMGYKRLYGITNPANISALWTYNALGFKTIKRFILYKFFDFIMYVNKIILATNNRRHPSHPLENRILYSFRHSKFSNKLHNK